MLVMDWGHTYRSLLKNFPYPVTIPRQCDDDQDGNYTLMPRESDLVQGQTNITVTYFDQNNNSLSSPFPSTLLQAHKR
jgi:hypothetical protein